jgi:hypothetical protein
MGDHSQEKEKKKEQTSSPDWIGTSTRVTAQLYSLVGWIGISTQPKLLTTATGETKHNCNDHPQTAPLRVSTPLK